MVVSCNCHRTIRALEVSTSLLVLCHFYASLDAELFCDRNYGIVLVEIIIIYYAISPGYLPTLSIYIYPSTYLGEAFCHNIFYNDSAEGFILYLSTYLEKMGFLPIFYIMIPKKSHI